MDYLVEFYDGDGRCFHKFRCKDEIRAITQLAIECKRWRGLGFRNASCYKNGAELWNLEIK